MKRLIRWAAASCALLASVGAIAATVVPSAAGDTAPGGYFAIGDLNATANAHVTFWGAQWWKKNSVSTGNRAPFKGYALTVDMSTCTFFSTRTGNSTPPPEPPLQTEDGVITVIVTDSVWQEGPVIKGSIKALAHVRVDSAYDDNPGHEGTGEYLGSFPCVGDTGEL
jgi:hypothetical protein